MVSPPLCDSCRVAVLVSGSGSNLQAILDASSSRPHSVCCVLSDRPDAYGLTRARRAGVAAAVVQRSEFSDRDAFEAAMIAALDRHDPQLVVLAGFMRVLGAGFVDRYAGRLLNIHPSLLPKYRGLNTYSRALAQGERWHGTSVHFVTEELDGGPVVAQARVRIEPDDDVASLTARVQAREHELYPQVVEWFCRGWLRLDSRGVWFRDTLLDTPRQLAAPVAATGT